MSNPRMAHDRSDSQPRHPPEIDTAWPGLKTLERWLDAGGCEATDGCWVPTGRNDCEHYRPTWLYLLGLSNACVRAHARSADQVWSRLGD